MRPHDPIATTARLVAGGSVLAVKGLGGFHLIADGVNEEAVQRLRKRKGREEKPFALMCFDTAQAKGIVHMDAEEEVLLTSIQRPIVLLEKKEPNSIAGGVSPGNRYFGVMLPYTPLHYLLLAESRSAWVMTSGNMSEEPICIDNRGHQASFGDCRLLFAPQP